MTPHSPEELAILSTFIHNLIGWLLLPLSAALMLEASRGVPKSRWRFAWPGVGAFIGFGLTVYIFFHQIFTHKLPPFADPLQNQHQLIGMTIGIGSAVEMIRRWRSSERRAFRVVWPLGVFTVGVLFLWHEQATPRMLIVHWALAATLILAALAFLATELTDESMRSFRMFGALLIAAASLQLVVFQEEPGAHEQHGEVQVPREHTAH